MKSSGVRYAALGVLLAGAALIVVDCGQRWRDRRRLRHRFNRGDVDVIGYSGDLSSIEFGCSPNQ